MHELNKQEKFEKWTRESIFEIRKIIGALANEFDRQITELKEIKKPIIKRKK